MAEQDWRSTSPPALDPVPPPLPPGGYDLRPLSVGEILDRVFSLYRGHFWFFAGLSAASAGVNATIGIVRLVYLHFAGPSAISLSHTLIAGGISIVQLLLYLLAYGVTIAATTFAVNAFYLGKSTSLGEALEVARHFWLRCVGITVWQGWSAGWAFLLLIVPIFLIPGLRGAFAGVAVGLYVFAGMVAGAIYGVIAYIRNSLALPAALIENLRVRAAMRRSKQLSAGRKGRIFLLLLLVWVLWIVAAAIQTPFIVLAARAGTAQLFLVQGILLAINFIVTTVVGPVAAIGLCLFYFDERVRREGFDIEMLLQGAGLADPPAPALPEPTIDPGSVNQQPAPEHT